MCIRDSIYTVVTTVQFENKEANLSVTYDADLQPMDAVVDVEKSLGQNMKEAGMNSILGIGTVFIMLIFLSFVIGLLKPVSEMIEGKNKKQPVPAEPAAPVIPAVEEEEEDVYKRQDRICPKKDRQKRSDQMSERNEILHKSDCMSDRMEKKIVVFWNENVWYL